MVTGIEEQETDEKQPGVTPSMHPSVLHTILCGDGWKSLITSELSVSLLQSSISKGVGKTINKDWACSGCSVISDSATHGLYSPPDCSVHGIFQARILKWVAISYSRGSFWPRDQTCASCIGRRTLYHCTTWEAQRPLSAKTLQSCPTLCDPMDCSLPGSSAHGILQARILEWVALSSYRGGLPDPGIDPGSPALAGKFFTTSATWEAQ